MLPILLIVVGIAVLIFGRRLSVLGAAVGALVGFVVLRLFGGEADLQTTLIATLILVALTAGGIAYQSGLLSRRSAAVETATPPAPPAPPPPAS